MTAKAMTMRKYPFGLTSRTWGAFGVHENVLYGAVYGGGIYRINADGSDTLVVNQNRNWYAMFSAFGKLFLLTNALSSSGLYEVNPYTGTTVLRYSMNTCYCGTQLGQLLYISGVIFDSHRGFMLAWTAGLGDGSAYVMRSADGGSNWTYDSTNVGFNDMILEPGGRLLGCRNGEIHAADNGLDFVQLPGAAAGIWAKLVYSPYHDIVAACAVTGTARFMTSLAGRKTPRRIWWSYASAPQRAFNQGLIGTPTGRIIALALEYSTTSVVYSDDVGLTWNTAATSNAVAPMSLIQVPYTNSFGYRLVATCETAPGLNPAMYSDDNGVTWTLASLAGVRGVIHLCRDHSTGYLFAVGYAGGNTSDTATTEILRSTDSGTTWTSIYTNVGGGLGMRIAYDPIRNRLCAITRNGVNHSYVSNDSGVTWTPYSGSAQRPWRDMCWDSARGCLVKVCHEGTRTATILGDTYNTVIMPDGKEWLAENLKYVNGGVGRWWNDAGSNDGDGAYYGIKGFTTEIDTLTGMLTGGWRVPSTLEALNLRSAIVAKHGGLPGGVFKTTGTTYWNAPNFEASNIYGFSARGSGRKYNGAWTEKKDYLILTTSDTRQHWFVCTSMNGGAGEAQATGDSLPYYTPIRLVRDYTPTSEHMYRSFDGGITWSPVPGVLPANTIVADRSGRLFTAGVGTGMRSDNGTDWSTISVDSGSSWRKLVLLERHDKIVGIANAGLNRFAITGNV